MRPWILGAMAVFSVWASAIASAPVIRCLRDSSADRCRTEVNQAGSAVAAFVSLAAGLLVPSGNNPPNP